VPFGRPCKLTPHPRREALARRDTGDEMLTDIARSYNVSHSTISRLCRAAEIVCALVTFAVAIIFVARIPIHRFL
jgi:hypothetical protein